MNAHLKKLLLLALLVGIAGWDRGCRARGSMAIGEGRDVFRRALSSALREPHPQGGSTRFSPWVCQWGTYSSWTGLSLGAEAPGLFRSIKIKDYAWTTGAIA